MSTFKINITNTPIVYTRKTSSKNIEQCDNIVTSFNIGLINSQDFNIINTYNGPNWNKLVITSINYQVFSELPESNLKYNNNIIQQSDLPLEIDISLVNDSGVIPGLILNIQKQNIIKNFELNKDLINFNFYIKSENNFIGQTLNSLFQINRIQCTTNNEPFISNIIIDNSETNIIKKSFKINGSANTNYKLKIIYDYKDRFGGSLSSLQNKNDLSYFQNIEPIFPNDNIIVDYITDLNGIIDLEYKLTALKTTVKESKNCTNVMIILYSQNDTSLLLNENIKFTACNEVINLGNNLLFDNDNVGFQFQ